jgi:hypothetical protein
LNIAVVVALLTSGGWYQLYQSVCNTLQTSPLAKQTFYHYQNDIVGPVVIGLQDRVLAETRSELLQQGVFKELQQCESLNKDIEKSDLSDNTKISIRDTEALADGRGKAEGHGEPDGERVSDIDDIKKSNLPTVNLDQSNSSDSKNSVLPGCDVKTLDPNSDTKVTSLLTIANQNQFLTF